MDIKEADTVDIELEEKNLEENMKLLKKFRSQKVIDFSMVRIFIAIWIVASLIALLPMLRPKHSDVEKRELKKFPKFSFTSLFSGDYFDEINLWFSDTFPLRDAFVTLNTKITNAFGVNNVQVHGNVVQGDEIPDASSTVESEPVDSSQTESVPEQETSQPPQEQLPAAEQIGAMLLINDSAFEYYNFIQSTADKYAATLNRAAALLDGKGSVYNMIVPTSMAITLPKGYEVNSSDQKSAIDYMYGIMTSNVHKIDAYNTLLKHKDEYIYFRTDHHWTALGAYYAYREFAMAKGFTPAELSSFKEYKFDGFLGTFYAESGQKASLGNNPDYVMAYEPTQVQYIHTYTQDYEKDYHIVSDVSGLSASEKYLTFVCGDHPYGVITNPEITDGSACLVIKESFGNAMVAYLTQHYQNVHVVDCREINQVFKGTLVQFVEERGIGDIIFMNNVSSTRNASIVNSIASFVG